VWADVIDAWGEISPLSGRELIAAQADQSAVSHKITLRFRPELSVPATVAAMRILFGTRVFNIHASMNEEERDRMLTLMVEEGLNNG